MSDKLKILLPGRACVGGQAFLPVTDRPGMTDLLSASGGLRRMVPRLILAVSAGSVGICLFLNASAATEENTEWTKYDNAVPPTTSDTTNWGNGRIPLGTSEQGDDKAAFGPAVIKDGSIYKMWYTGNAVSGNKLRIYYATSPDGLTWTKYNNDVPDPSNATGTDGRIPLGTSGGDVSATYQPAVILVGSTYKMWYSGSDGANTRIYHATSSNGLTWAKYTNAVPDDSNTNSTYGRIPLGETGGDINNVSAACVIKEGLIQEGYTYKMWYSGLLEAGKSRIYHATCKQPPVEGTIFYSY